MQIFYASKSSLLSEGFLRSSKSGNRGFTTLILKITKGTIKFPTSAKVIRQYKQDFSTPTGWVTSWDRPRATDAGRLKTWKTVLAACPASCSVIINYVWVHGNGSCAVLPLTRHQCSIHCETSRVVHSASKRRGTLHNTGWHSERST